MAASKEQILESISNMTLMEVVDLVKMMEDKFGVTAAAPVAAAAAGAGAAAPVVPAKISSAATTAFWESIATAPAPSSSSYRPLM